MSPCFSRCKDTKKIQMVSFFVFGKKFSTGERGGGWRSEVGGRRVGISVIVFWFLSVCCSSGNFFYREVKLFLQTSVMGYEQQLLVKKSKKRIFLSGNGKFFVLLHPEKK